MRTNLILNNAIIPPILLSPYLSCHPTMRKGAAPKRDPFRAISRQNKSGLF